MFEGLMNWFVSKKEKGFMYGHSKKIGIVHEQDSQCLLLLLWAGEQWLRLAGELYLTRTKEWIEQCNESYMYEEQENAKIEHLLCEKFGPLLFSQKDGWTAL